MRGAVDVTRVLAERAHRLTGAADDYDPLLDIIGDARVVLLGEASHGTHEFYAERAAITRRLIAEAGFHAVAVEADWPDAYRANCYVRGSGDDADADAALGGFKRFPTWMWRNRDVLAFVEWLRGHNAGRPEAEQAGFYGLDLYSLQTSMQAVVHYLEQIDPEAAQRARARYACFDHLGVDPQSYGYAASLGVSRSCEDAVVVQLLDLRRQAFEYTHWDGPAAEDQYFYAEQNARLAKNAEEYYRTMFGGRVAAWNLRDCHMGETLDALLSHLRRRYPEPRIVVWEHNSHIGDARATELGRGGELNVGQLARERYGHDACLIGFTTFTGTVTAASDWDEPPRRQRVRPALPESYEHRLHEVGESRYLLDLADDAVADALREPRLERAIGVVYRPETERLSHYFQARLPNQFDAVIHLDETQAVVPLEPNERWHRGEPPETYPRGV